MSFSPIAKKIYYSVIASSSISHGTIFHNKIMKYKENECKESNILDTTLMVGMTVNACAVGAIYGAFFPITVPATFYYWRTLNKK